MTPKESADPTTGGFSCGGYTPPGITCSRLPSQAQALLAKDIRMFLCCEILAQVGMACHLRPMKIFFPHPPQRFVCPTFCNH